MTPRLQQLLKQLRKPPTPWQLHVYLAGKTTKVDLQLGAGKLLLLEAGRTKQLQAGIVPHGPLRIMLYQSSWNALKSWRQTNIIMSKNASTSWSALFAWSRATITMNKI